MCSIYTCVQAGPDGSFESTGLVAWRYQVRIPIGTDILYRCCAYTVLQTVQIHGVLNSAYDSVHYNEPLTSF